MRPFWLTLGLRELRGGLAGFRTFLACLVLGVAGIATVGSVIAAIGQGLSAEGREILGGDVSLAFAYRFASEEERAWMEAQGAVSEVVDLRSMLGTGEGDRALAQVKGVDAAYPLVGEVRLSGGIPLTEALEPRDGVPGLVVERVLAERLRLSPGDRVRLAGGTFAFRAVLEHEPDSLSGGIALGPRVIVRTAPLREAGLLKTGTLFTTLYRIRLDEARDLPALKAAFTARFPEAGARWRDVRNAAPRVGRFVERIGAFLTLTGLAALAIGGVGVGAAVRGYLDRKTRSIAALRAIGAGGGELLAAYAFQVAVIAGLGIAGGVALGAGAAVALGPLVAERLPVPAAFGVYPGPLGLAALYGALTAGLVTLWPLARLRETRPALLFRDLGETGPRWPRPGVLGALAIMALALGGAVVGLSGAPELALWAIAGVAAGFAVLRGLGVLCRRGARALARGTALRHRPGLRLALGAVGAPGGPTVEVVLALGMALAVLAAIGQIDANLQRLIREQLPAGSPAFFFVDIQNEQLARFRQLVSGVEGVEGVERIETAPMLRGFVTRLDGVPAEEAEIDPDAAWVLRGDRGVTYAAERPADAELTAGEWWPADYEGEPLVSFADEEGRELGLEVGSTVTINVLGRPITARVANLRRLEWEGLGINFLMVMNPGALRSAPHSHIATVHAPPAAEAAIMDTVARELPNVTVIRVRDQVEQVAGALADLGRATRWASGVLLLTGLVVLIGAAATAAERQLGEAAILKVLGAERRRILASFALRAVILGGVAGVVALGVGTVAGWAATHFALGAEFAAQPLAGLAIVVAGIAVSLAAGLAFALRPLAVRPARVLRRAAG